MKIKQNEASIMAKNVYGHQMKEEFRMHENYQKRRIKEDKTYIIIVSAY